MVEDLVVRNDGGGGGKCTYPSTFYLTRYAVQAFREDAEDVVILSSAEDSECNRDQSSVYGGTARNRKMARNRLPQIFSSLR